MTSRSSFTGRLGVAALLVCSFLAPAHAAETRAGWARIVHPERGFTISYPSDVFAPQPGVVSEDGNVLVSRDGAAKLLVGTFDNTGDFTPASYRRFLLENNYDNAVLDYDRRQPRWFVISGTRGDTMFYERVTFVCGGRLINSWAMLYPVAERSFYDRIVEKVARTYSPGAGASGCD